MLCLRGVAAWLLLFQLACAAAQGAGGGYDPTDASDAPYADDDASYLDDEDPFWFGAPTPTSTCPNLPHHTPPHPNTRQHTPPYPTVPHRTPPYPTPTPPLPPPLPPPLLHPDPTPSPTPPCPPLPRPCSGRSSLHVCASASTRPGCCARGAGGTLRTGSFLGPPDP